MGADNQVLLAAAGLLTGVVGLGCLYRGVVGGKKQKKTMADKLRDLLPKKGEAGYKVVTKEELMAHKFPPQGKEGEVPERAWMLLYGVIFDVTDYLDVHPGGFEILADQCADLAEWCADPSTPSPPDSGAEFEPYHDASVLPQVTGASGVEGGKSTYVGHYVE